MNDNDDIKLLIKSLIEEQEKTNQLLAMLVDALAEEHIDIDEQPTHYIDGTPIDG